jgi:predicted transposase/invertase (TIGR01784 family)
MSGVWHYSFLLPQKTGGNEMNEKKMYAGLPRPKKFEELEYRDDFMFCRTMEDVKLCHDVIECLMQKPVGELTQVQSQREIKITSDGKPIRLDIYSEEPGTVYDAEMQNKNNQSVETMALPKRSRFYQSSIDNDHMVKKGMYKLLPVSKVIFICTFDPFGKGLGRYTFRERCDEMPELELGDGTEKHFFNCTYRGNDIPESMLRFYEYVDKGVPSDDLTRRIHEAVIKGRKNDMWESSYLREQVLFNEMKAEAHEIGLEEGRTEERIRTISNLLHSGKSAEAIADFCGYPLEQVKEVEKNLLSS